MRQNHIVFIELTSTVNHPAVIIASAPDREEAVGIGQPDSVAKYGIGESVGRAGDVVEDDYGISVKAERSVGSCSCVRPPMLRLISSPDVCI